MSRGCPVRYKDRTFPSGRALARHLGVSQSRIYAELEKSGHLENLNLTNSFPGGQPQPTRVGDREFPSLTAAARALGISVSHASRYRKRYGSLDGLYHRLSDTGEANE